MNSVLNKHAKVIILVDEDNQSEIPVTKVMKQLQLFNDIINQRVNLPKVDKEIDINALCNEINSDIF